MLRMSLGSPQKRLLFFRYGRCGTRAGIEVAGAQWAFRVRNPRSGMDRGRRGVWKKASFRGGAPAVPRNRAGLLGQALELRAVGACDSIGVSIHYAGILLARGGVYFGEGSCRTPGHLPDRRAGGAGIRRDLPDRFAGIVLALFGAQAGRVFFPVETKRAGRRGLRLGAFALCVRVIGKSAMHILYAGKFDGLAPLLYLLAFSPLFIGISGTMVNGLISAERPKLVFWGYLSSGTATFLLGIPLVMHFGLRGAVYGILVSGSTLATVLTCVFLLTVRRRSGGPQPGEPGLRTLAAGSMGNSSRRS